MQIIYVLESSFYCSICRGVDVKTGFVVRKVSVVRGAYRMYVMNSLLLFLQR